MQYLPKRSFNRDDYAANRVPGAIGYLLFFVPLAACPGSVYGKFCANQGLIYLIASAVLYVAMRILGAIPFISLITVPVLWLAQMALFALELFLMILALNGDVRELPFIGSITLLR